MGHPGTGRGVASPAAAAARVLRRSAAMLAGAVFAVLLFTGLAAAGPPPAETSLWKVVVFGIPLSVLAASLAGRTARYLGEPSQPDAKIPATVFGIVADGFIGGWLAMVVVGLPATREHLGSVAPEVVGALLALTVQYLRDNAPRWGEQLFQTVVSWWTRKRPAERTPGGDR